MTLGFSHSLRSVQALSGFIFLVYEIVYRASSHDKYSPSLLSLPQGRDDFYPSLGFSRRPDFIGTPQNDTARHLAIALLWGYY